ATNADDVIAVDFVTEPGLLTDHHLVTRLTNNNGNFSFAAQVRLDFNATNENDEPVWDPLDVLNLDGLRSGDVIQRSELLAALPNRIEKNIAELIPSEGDFLAILIDALGGNDQITVGPTVQKTVWIDAGDGDDRVEILAGNAILIDKAEFGVRNDQETRAYSLPGAAVITPAGPAPSSGILSTSEPAEFTIVIEQSTDRIERSITLHPDQTNGFASETGFNGSFENPVAALIEDVNGLLRAAGIGSLVTAFEGMIEEQPGIFFATSDVTPGATLELIVYPDDPAATVLGLASGTSTGSNVITRNTTYSGLTIDNPQDVDWFTFRFNEAPDADAEIYLKSGSSIDALGLAIFPAGADTSDPNNQLNAATLRTTGQASAISLAGLSMDQTYWLRVDSPNVVPTIYDLTFVLSLADGAAATVELDDLLDVVDDRLVVSLGQRADVVRRDVILGGAGDDILSGGPAEDWIFGGPGNDVLTGGLDRQAPDLLFGEAGDDTFQIIADQLPTLPDGETTFVPTFADEFNGGAGDDRVLFLGGDFDRRGNEVPDYASLRYNRFLHRYEFTNLVWDIENQAFLKAEEVAPTTLIAERDLKSADLGGPVSVELIVGDPMSPDAVSAILTLEHRGSGAVESGDNAPFDVDALVLDLNDVIDATNGTRLAQGLAPLNVVAKRDELRIVFQAIGASSQQQLTIRFQDDEFNESLGFSNGQSFQSGGNLLAQRYLFYTETGVERTVIDLQAGDDVFRGDPQFKFPGSASEWGIDPGDFEQRGLIGSLEVRGGDGNDVLFGGALGDVLIGGPGIDWINGGEGDDEISGGPGADFLAGNITTLSELFEEDDNEDPLYRTFDFAGSPTGIDIDDGIESEPYRYQLAAPLFALTVEDGRTGVTLPTPPEIAAAPASIPSYAFDRDVFSITSDTLSNFQEVGDFNGDGLTDFLASEEGADKRSYLLFGPIDLSGVHDFEDEANIIIEHAALGLPASPMGNVNGDAFGDLAFARTEADQTIITVVYGGTFGRVGAETTLDWPRHWDATFVSGDAGIGVSAFLDNTNSRRLRLNEAQLSPQGLEVGLLNFDGDLDQDTGNALDDLFLSSPNSVPAVDAIETPGYTLLDSGATEFNGQLHFIGDNGADGPQVLKYDGSSVVPAFGSNYAGEVFNDNPLHYYRFDEPVLVEAINRGRAGVDLRYERTDSTLGISQVDGAIAASGSVNPGIAFDGFSNALDGIIDSTGVFPFGSGQANVERFSVEFWVKRQPTNEGDTETLVSYADSQFSTQNLFRVSHPAALKIYIDGNDLDLGTSIDVATGNWHHVAITWEGMNEDFSQRVNLLHVYVDGDAVVDGRQFDTADDYSLTPTGRFRIGTHHDTPGTNQHFLGEFDELAIYDDVLSEERVQSHYSVGVGTATPDQTLLPAGAFLDGTSANLRSLEIGGIETLFFSTLDGPDGGHHYRYDGHELIPVTFGASPSLDWDTASPSPIQELGGRYYFSGETVSNSFGDIVVGRQLFEIDPIRQDVEVASYIRSPFSSTATQGLDDETRSLTRFNGSLHFAATLGNETSLYKFDPSLPLTSVLGLPLDQSASGDTLVSIIGDPMPEPSTLANRSVVLEIEFGRRDGLSSFTKYKHLITLTVEPTDTKATIAQRLYQQLLGANGNYDGVQFTFLLGLDGQERLNFTSYAYDLTGGFGFIPSTLRITTKPNRIHRVAPNLEEVGELFASSTELYVSASSTSNNSGRELYRVLTNDAVSLVSDVYPGSTSSTPTDFSAYQNRIVFSALGATSGRELWALDPSTDVIEPLFDLNAAGDSNPTELIVADDLLYFSADGGNSVGRELYRYDGEHVHLVEDLSRGPDSGSPK
ncbi:MAG: LamG-like jellyroll fold domain-containing protein, partial [Planctomycetota bacterium]